MVFQPMRMKQHYSIKHRHPIDYTRGKVVRENITGSLEEEERLSSYGEVFHAPCATIEVHETEG